MFVQERIDRGLMCSTLQWKTVIATFSNDLALPELWIPHLSYAQATKVSKYTSIDLPTTGESISSYSDDALVHHCQVLTKRSGMNETGNEESNSASVGIQVKTIVSGLSVFLVFYQLLFHLSGHAIATF